MILRSLVTATAPYRTRHEKAARSRVAVIRCTFDSVREYRPMRLTPSMGQRFSAIFWATWARPKSSSAA